MAPDHPFTPSTADIPGYRPGELSLATIFTCYLVPLSIVCMLVFFFLKHDQHGKKFCASERMFLLWFTVCGFTHICVEIPFTLGQKSMAWRTDIWSEIWKEYSKADSRYILAQPATVAIEMITSWILGPLCVMVVWLHYKCYTTRYVVELIIATSHLYGTTVYYLDEHLSGYEHTPVGDRRYFYLYFVVLNSPWLFFPIVIIWKNYLILAHCQAVFEIIAAKSKQDKNVNVTAKIKIK